MIVPVISHFSCLCTSLSLCLNFNYLLIQPQVHSKAPYKSYVKQVTESWAYRLAAAGCTSTWSGV